MQKVTIQSICDKCGTSMQEDARGLGVPIALEMNTPVHVDLCDSCLLELHELLDEIISAGISNKNKSNTSARKGRGNWNKREQVACTICGKLVATGAGQVLHARKIHGLERPDIWTPAEQREPVLQDA